MTSSAEVNLLNVTWSKDGGLPTHNRMWLLCFLVSFVIGLTANVLVAFAATRWCLLRSRLRHFRSLSDALIGQCVSGALSCCCGLVITMATLVSLSHQLTPEVLCRAGAALPQLVLSSASTAAVLFVLSHCDAVTCCRRLQKMASTCRTAAPLTVGLITGSLALGDPASGNWLDSACAADSGSNYRLLTVLAAVCFIASTSGTVWVLSNHMTLRRPVGKMAELLPVPLTELKTYADDSWGVGGGHVTSGDVTTVQQTCRISCEAAPETSRQDQDEFGSWRCSSKMGLFSGAGPRDPSHWSRQ